MSHTPESQHWYDRNGQPVYTVKSKDGRDIAPDIRHARKLGLVPGFNAISKVLSSPALERYKQEQAILAALTLTRTPGEDDKSFLARVREDSAAHAKQRAEEGTKVHKAIEQWLRGESFTVEWSKHCKAVIKLLESLPPSFIGDFKTKESLEGKREKDVFYNEHIMQLAAYRSGFALPFPHVEPITGQKFICETTFASSQGYGGRIDVHSLVTHSTSSVVSIAISINEPGKLLHKIWTEEEAQHGLKLFSHALAVWKLRNRYESGWTTSTSLTPTRIQVISSVTNISTGETYE